MRHTLNKRYIFKRPYDSDDTEDQYMNNFNSTKKDPFKPTSELRVSQILFQP
jgi:hypothetical protein